MKYRKVILLCVGLFIFNSLSYCQKKNSLYSAIFEEEGLSNIILNTDFPLLIRKSASEKYQQAEISILTTPSDTLVTLPCRIRARGNMRKQQCRFPPIKIDFQKGDLDSLGFKKKIDKLKMVLPCRSGTSSQEKLYKEFLLYDIYKIIDTLGLNAKLANIHFIGEDGKETEFVGMFVEEERAYSRRTGAKIVESGKLRAASLERDYFLKMNFFQYMIANTDFSVSNKHNLEMVKRPERARVIAMPYDFDYAGFVGHSYAVPHESLPIKDVNQRYFFKYVLTEKEFEEMVNYFLSIEDEINKVIDDATYLSEKSRSKCKNYLKPFFNALRKPKVLRRDIQVK